MRAKMGLVSVEMTRPNSRVLRVRFGPLVLDRSLSRGHFRALEPAEIEARWLYETIYCARGEMENRIKECQLDLFADRTSAATMRAKGSPGGCVRFEAAPY